MLEVAAVLGPLMLVVFPVERVVREEAVMEQLITVLLPQQQEQQIRAVAVVVEYIILEPAAQAALVSSSSHGRYKQTQQAYSHIARLEYSLSPQVSQASTIW